MKKNNNKKMQVHVFYSGLVQGVGFRYRTQAIAQDLHTEGWVRNLPDGRVEVLAEGEKVMLDNFLRRLEASFDMYIKNKQESWQDAEGKLSGFSIRF